MGGKEDAVEALITGGVNVNFGNPPPITIAASMGRINSLKLLIEYSADVGAEVSFVFMIMIIVRRWTSR